MRMDPLKETSSMNMAQRKPPMAVMTESSDRESVSSYENDDDNYTNNSNGCDDETNLTSEVDTEAEDTRAMFMKARMMMSDPVTMMRARNEKPVPSSTTQGSFTNGRSPAARNNALGQVAPQQYQQQQQRQQQPKQAPAEADRTNDMVYKALMEHKKAEMQRMKTLASDTRTITEAMLRKQVCIRVYKNPNMHSTLNFLVTHRLKPSAPSSPYPRAHDMRQTPSTSRSTAESIQTYACMLACTR